MAAEAADAQLSIMVLPDGLPIKYVSKLDAEFLYREVVEQAQYQRLGAELATGAVIVDVGANIGFFTMLAAKASGIVLAIEPIAANFGALQWNLASLRRHQPAHELAEVRLLNVGVSDGSTDKASSRSQFTFYERASGWSTTRPDPNEVDAAMAIFLRNTLGGSELLPDGPLASAGKWLRDCCPSWLYDAAVRNFVQHMLGKQSKVSCPLLSLSDIIIQEDLTQIDLLKVDVERAELDVLRGVVLEIHDQNGQLQAAVDLLRGAAFAPIQVTQAEELRGSTLYNLYAHRSAPVTPGTPGAWDAASD
eukprot:SM000115S23893  [mRNA]  locus=s115:35527:38871:+ [translate_table: standard]